MVNKEGRLTSTWRRSTKKVKIIETKRREQVLTGSTKQNHQPETFDNRVAFIYFRRKTKSQQKRSIRLKLYSRIKRDELFTLEN